MKRGMHAITFLLLFVLVPGYSQAGTSELISASPEGWLGDGESLEPLVTADGRFVVFQSDASNLVPGDTNGATDIFVYDRFKGDMERVSVDSYSNEADGRNYDPHISDDGRYVAFQSWATNLTSDYHYTSGIYIRDRETGVTTVVDLSLYGSIIPSKYNRNIRMSMSGDGSTLLLGGVNLAVDMGLENVFPHTVIMDIASGSMSGLRFVSDADRVSSNGVSSGNFGCQMSYDGMRIVFQTSELYWLDDGMVSQIDNVHVYDRVSDTTIDLTDAKKNRKKIYTHPVISADGNWVAYSVSGSNKQTYVTIKSYDGKRKETVRHQKASSAASISDSGRYLTIVNDRDEDKKYTYDLYDRKTGTWEPVIADEPVFYNSLKYLTPNTRFLTFLKPEMVTIRGYSATRWHVYLYDRLATP